jgi:hypothetical protein
MRSPICLGLSSRSEAERSAFLLDPHKIVISTEGVAVVEKPAGKADSTTALTVKRDSIGAHLRDLWSN